MIFLPSERMTFRIGSNQMYWMRDRAFFLAIALQGENETATSPWPLEFLLNIAETADSQASCKALMLHRKDNYIDMRVQRLSGCPILNNK